MKERVQKILSACGIASRRKSEELIDKGQVKVNGKKIKLGDKADIEKDTITVNGKIAKPQRKKYILYNKPLKVVTSTKDPHEKTLIELLPKKLTKECTLYPVGRLDKNTEGLILLTNDGDFSNIVTHPSFKIQKKYIALVQGHVLESNIELLRTGVKLEEGKTHPAKVFSESLGRNTIIKIKIHTGWNRQVRRMIESIGHKVIKLKRVELGILKLGTLKSGKYRELTREEIESIKKTKKKILPKDASKLKTTEKKENNNNNHNNQLKNREKNKDKSENKNFYKTNRNNSKNKSRTNTHKKNYRK